MYGVYIESYLDTFILILIISILKVFLKVIGNPEIDTIKL